MSALAHNPILDECLCEDCRFLNAIGPVLAKYRDTRERREAAHLLRAVRLGQTLDVCEAILRGERVHRSRLDADWLRRYGRS